MPACAWYRPAVQLWHVAAFAELVPTKPNWPAEHTTPLQMACAAASVYLPDWHVEQDVFAVVCEYFPVGHNLHRASPGLVAVDLA